MFHERQFSDAQAKTNCRGRSAYPPEVQANRIPAFCSSHKYIIQRAVFTDVRAARFISYNY